MSENKRTYMKPVPRVDLDHLLSEEQVEIVRTSTRKGDEISFLRGEELIEGIVDKIYQHVFLLTDGRSFRWVDYILGNVRILYYLKEYHPVKGFKIDHSINRYSYRMERT